MPRNYHGVTAHLTLVVSNKICRDFISYINYANSSFVCHANGWSYHGDNNDVDDNKAHDDNDACGNLDNEIDYGYDDDSDDEGERTEWWFW